MLYSSNCFSISSIPLLLNLPRLLLPQRLAAMTSLELFIEARGIKDDHGGYKYPIDHLPPILDNISTHCRHLRRITIAIGCNSMFPIDGYPAPHLDAFYRSMQLRDMRVELPTVSIFKCGRPVDVPLHPSDPLDIEDYLLLWRCLDDDEPQTHLRYPSTYPYPPPKTMTPEDRRGNVPSAGYWVRRGQLKPDGMRCTLL